MKSKPYISALTENDIAPDPKWYAKMKRKTNSITIESKANDINDEILGTLLPIVYRLNRGRDIKCGSHEHKWLKELLIKVNKA